MLKRNFIRVFVWDGLVELSKIEGDLLVVGFVL
jgi:hypothetical protein